MAILVTSGMVSEAMNRAAAARRALSAGVSARPELATRWQALETRMTELLDLQQRLTNGSLLDPAAANPAITAPMVYEGAQQLERDYWTLGEDLARTTNGTNPVTLPGAAPGLLDRLESTARWVAIAAVAVVVGWFVLRR